MKPVLSNPRPLVQKNLQKFFTRKTLTFKTDEGMVDLPLVAWDSISSCDGTSCPIGLRRCPFGRTQHHRIQSRRTEQKCLVQAKYLRLVYQHLISSNTRRNLRHMDEMTMTNIGLLLLPLYGQLIKFKLIEASLALSDTIGPRGPHPVYKSIRDIMTAIRETARDILPNNILAKATQAIDVQRTLDSPGQSYHERLERTVEREYQRGNMITQS